MGKVILKRESAYGDRLRAYKILIDGKEVGKIKNGETWIHSVPDEEHTLQLKIDWCKTPLVHFSSKSDSETFFECHSNIIGWKVPLAVFFLFMPHKWIVLKLRS